MKFSVCVTALYLAGLGATAPVNNERAILEPVHHLGAPVGIDTRELEAAALEKRKKKPKPKTPEADKPKTPAPEKTTPTTKAAKTTTTTTKEAKTTTTTSAGKTTTTKSSTTKTSASGTSTTSGSVTRTSTGTTTTGTKTSTTTGTSTGTSTGTNTATTTTTSSTTRCARSSATPTKGSKNARGSKSGDEADGEACELEQYLDFGNGWRTPVEDEQKAARVEVAGGSITYRTMEKDFPKPPKVKYSNGAKGLPKVDCPKDAADVLAKGQLETPPDNSVLFYSVVGGTEKEWATSESKGFRFMLDVVKDPNWVIQNFGCPRIWPYLSEATAMVASGDVHVLLPSKTFNVGQKPVWPKPNKPNAKENQNSVWEDFEWPAILNKNTKACRVWRWVKGSNTPDLLAVRTGGTCSPKYEPKPKGTVAKKVSE